MLKAGSHGCSLTEVSNEFENADAVIGTLQFSHELETSIRTAVVNDENLVGFFQGPEYAGQALIKGPEALLFVEDRNENGQVPVPPEQAVPPFWSLLRRRRSSFCPEYTVSLLLISVCPVEMFPAARAPPRNHCRSWYQHLLVVTFPGSLRAAAQSLSFPPL